MNDSSHRELVARSDRLERRLAAVEDQVRALTVAGASTASPTGHSAPDFYALEGVQRSMPDGGVVYAGAVTVESGPVEWQIGMPAEQVMSMEWSDRAAALAALGHPVRARLMQAIMAGVTTTHELGTLEQIGTTGQLYHHLGQLTAAGWLRSEGRGRYVIPVDRVVPVMVMMIAAGGV